jgi:signal recognition particle receptor subunit alpha
MRKWADSTGAGGGGTVTQAEMDSLDFSGPDGQVEPSDSGVVTPAAVDLDALVSTSAMGKVGNDGLYEVADWDTGRKEDGSGIAREDEILARGRKAYPALFGAAEQTTAPGGDSDVVVPEPSKAGSALSSLFSRFTGVKVLTKQDLEPVLAEMEKHLMSKNVAKDIAEKICDGVGAALVGKKLGGLTSTYAGPHARYH